MRLALVSLILAVAAGAPAWAQTGLLQQRDVEFDAAMAQARQRDIATQNELMALDARLRTDQALREAPGLRPVGPTRILPGAPTPRYVDVSEARLAASNARVKAAAENRRQQKGARGAAWR